MNLLQIEYFLTLAKFGSFRKTAEHLYVSQPAVSKQISLLEKEWGFPLFERSYRMVTLTPSGKLMLEAIQQSQKLYEDALYQAKLRGQADRTELQLGIMEHSDLVNLSDILAQFQQEHPEVALKVQQFPISQLLLQHPDGEYDMVINHERNLRNKCELETRVLARRRHVAILSRYHPLWRGNETRLEDLKGERVYVPAPVGTTLTVDYCAYICAHHGFTPREVVPLPNVESVLLAVKMGFGFAVLGDLITLPHPMELETIPTDVTFEVLLAWHKENRNPAIPILASEILENLNLKSTV